jgi:hypothetical protein
VIGLGLTALFGIGVLWLGLHRHLRRSEIRVRAEREERE